MSDPKRAYLTCTGGLGPIPNTTREYDSKQNQSIWHSHRPKSCLRHRGSPRRWRKNDLPAHGSSSGDSILEITFLDAEDDDAGRISDSERKIPLLQFASEMPCMWHTHEPHAPDNGQSCSRRLIDDRRKEVGGRLFKEKSRDPARASWLSKMREFGIDSINVSEKTEEDFPISYAIKYEGRALDSLSECEKTELADERSWFSFNRIITTDKMNELRPIISADGQVLSQETSFGGLSNSASFAMLGADPYTGPEAMMDGMSFIEQGYTAMYKKPAAREHYLRNGRVLEEVVDEHGKETERSISQKWQALIASNDTDTVDFTTCDGKMMCHPEDVKPENWQAFAAAWRHKLGEMGLIDPSKPSTDAVSMAFTAADYDKYYPSIKLSDPISSLAEYGRELSKSMPQVLHHYLEKGMTPQQALQTYSSCFNRTPITAEEASTKFSLALGRYSAIKSAGLPEGEEATLCREFIKQTDEWRSYLLVKEHTELDNLVTPPTMSAQKDALIQALTAKMEALNGQKKKSKRRQKAEARQARKEKSKDTSSPTERSAPSTL